jgi:hypothetical protein
VRRRKTPLTPEQSACLTEFCTPLAERKFASLRLVGQLTPFRTRFPLRTALVGKPDLDRSNYFCSELVLNSLVAAGVLNPRVERPAASFPSDLFYGHSRNLWVNRGVRPINCARSMDRLPVPCRMPLQVIAGEGIAREMR